MYSFDKQTISVKYSELKPNDCQDIFANAKSTGNSPSRPPLLVVQEKSKIWISLLRLLIHIAFLFVSTSFFILFHNISFIPWTSCQLGQADCHVWICEYCTRPGLTAPKPITSHFPCCHRSRCCRFYLFTFYYVIFLFGSIIFVQLASAVVVIHFNIGSFADTALHLSSSTVAARSRCGSDARWHDACGF